MTFATPAAWSASRTFVSRRLPNEFYPTPPEATRALLSVESFDGPIWEPACGDGRIAQVLLDHGYTVIATDLHPYGYGASGVDFLREAEPRARHIVTNPPYGSGLADRFVRKALAFARKTGGTVAMLLNMASLCHPRRTEWWRQAPPARLYAIDDIVCWPEDRYGPPPAYFTKHRYVWAVWTQDSTSPRRPPTFWWLSGAGFRAPHATSTPDRCHERRFA
jgi:predicted RNA methylase